MSIVVDQQRAATQVSDRRHLPEGGTNDVLVASHRRFFCDLVRDALPSGSVRMVVDTLTHPGSVEKHVERGLVVVIDGAPGDDRPNRIRLTTVCREAGSEVLVVFSPSDSLSVAEWVEAGASAVLTEDSSCAEFADLLDRLRKREAVLGVAVREGLLAQLRRFRQAEGERFAVFASLTKREAHVLRELARGASPEEVAKASYVSLNTVRTQIRGVLAKLGVNSVVAAVVTAYRAGWIDADSALLD
jgi:DNA-binding NarL/FixJ family response regulator